MRLFYLSINKLHRCKTFEKIQCSYRRNSNSKAGFGPILYPYNPKIFQTVNSWATQPQVIVLVLYLEDDGRFELKHCSIFKQTIA